MNTNTNADYHYGLALQASFSHYYPAALQHALDALHTEALAEDTARTAARLAARERESEWVKARLRANYGYCGTWNCIRFGDGEEGDCRFRDGVRLATRTLVRADWLDDDLLSGMFAAMSHDELHNEYGLQEVIAAGGDYAYMFDLHRP